MLLLVAALYRAYNHDCSDHPKEKCSEAQTSGYGVDALWREVVNPKRRQPSARQRTVVVIWGHPFVLVDAGATLSMLLN